MHIPLRLTRHDPELNMARFYSLSVEPTLFGEWALMRQWGRIDTQGRSHTEVFASRVDAVRRATRTIHAKAKRGYVIAVFD